LHRYSATRHPVTGLSPSVGGGVRFGAMRFPSVIAAALLVGAPALVAQEPPIAEHGPQHTLMPVPRTVTRRDGRLRLDSTFTVAIARYDDARLRRAIARAVTRLEARIGRPLSRAIGTDASRATLVVNVERAGQTIQGPDENESYVLDISAGRAELRAPTVVGALRGLETVLQLGDRDESTFALPAVLIDDAPRFPWRGLLIDVGRHFMPIEVIERTLDGMAVVKLNVLHWHLSEDQGFRVESKRYPRLQELGSDGSYYTQAQIREVVAYARDRGIRVIPEFDMPGHSAAWFVGYPRYASGPGPFEIVRRFGIFDPVFDPTREEVYTFLDGFVGEMSRLFPDPYWHIGGDEVNGVQWKANARIQAFMQRRKLKDKEALQAYFNQRLSRILTRHGKRVVGWDEVLHPDLPRNTVVQSWRGIENLAKAAEAGYAGILSAPYYLDQIQTAEEHYVADPLPGWTTLTAEQQRLVLGGEACMWAEHVTPETIDSRIWPRLAAVAERLWSPRTVMNVDDMYRRLAATSVRLEAVGLTHESHTERMLRRMLDDRPSPGLRAFMEAVQPVNFGQRARMEPLTQQTPLVRAIDAARPDPPARWNTIRLVEAAIASGPPNDSARRVVRERLTAWRDAGASVKAVAEAKPSLREVQTAADALSRVAAIGLEALDMITTGTRPAPGWGETTLAELTKYDGPQGLLRLVVIAPVKRLVERAALNSH
jgi:hexosaminidase